MTIYGISASELKAFALLSDCGTGEPGAEWGRIGTFKLGINIPLCNEYFFDSGSDNDDSGSHAADEAEKGILSLHLSFIITFIISDISPGD